MAQCTLATLGLLHPLRTAMTLPLLLMLLLAACSGGHGLHDEEELPPYHFPTGPTIGQLRVQANATTAAVTAAASAGSSSSSTPSSNVTVVSATLAAGNASAAAAATISTPTTAAVNGTTTTPSKAKPARTTPASSASGATLRPFVEPTKSAAVLVGVFVSLALLGYLGLMVWRRVLERRYGNREILINEEQFDHERDLGNFQL
ncbi:integumentary mucin C.1-like [Frankliniella occidentalis]|uniref:Integumentary mucin C.1-like n=1 Tax=Frankliniella occidentalis TaxID=133901 RepID=A0A6J1S2J2_FRAOC|nr:integumentary mucin C.1-like [Frankliniella occidentalis]